jgi:hypothetical protein
MKYRTQQTLLERLINFRPLWVKPPSTTFRLRPAALNPRQKLRKQAIAYAQAVRRKRKQALAYILALQKTRELALGYGQTDGEGRQLLTYSLSVQRMKNQALAYKLAILRERERAQAYFKALQGVKLDDALAVYWKTRKALAHALEVKTLEMRRSREGTGTKGGGLGTKTRG